MIHGLLRDALGDLLHGVRLRQDEDLWVDVGPDPEAAP